MKINQKHTSIFIANWKMNMPMAQAREFLDTHQKALERVAQEHYAQVVLCPSFLALDYFCNKTKNNNLAKNSWIKIGAQDCSEHKSGAYTGQVDAASLSVLGCEYGIVGHSERRMYCGETDEMVAQKAARLAENGITPILCIGETEQEFESQRTKEVLKRQLAPVIALLKKNTPTATPSASATQLSTPFSGPQADLAKKLYTKIIIAYEPAYAIGSGKTPEFEHLAEVFSWLQETTSKLPGVDVRLIYGGSVTESNAAALLGIPYISGLLIGTASLDFQKFQNIVSSNSR